VMSVSVCVCVCVYLSVIIPSDLRVQSSPNFSRMIVTRGRGLVLFWQSGDMSDIFGFMDDVIFAHKLRLLDVSARLRQRGSHAALGLACRNTRGTTSCSQVLLGRM